MRFHFLTEKNWNVWEYDIGFSLFPQAIHLFLFFGF